MRVGIILLVVAAVLAATLGLLWLFQRRLIYFPTPGPVPPAASVLPAAEEVSFETADGLRLNAWFVPSAMDNPGPPAVPGPAVLVCNGNGGDRSMRAALAAAL
ncbi:MAG TPA: alpha/beta hydrolase, partial [Actinomycetes bacterium]|nr:alpha/beta hydrolase [Actinomycetes bacterium]